MRYLLDTCIIIWIIEGSFKKIPDNFHKELTNENNILYVSVISLLEILIKGQKNNDVIDIRIVLDFLFQNKIKILSLEVQHMHSFATLPMHHKDPFDRMIIAQSLSENMKIITTDRFFDNYFQ